MGEILSCCKNHIFFNEKLRIVDKLPEQQQNKIIPMEQILNLHPQYIGNKNASYFPYNNVYKDIGWGCAWRAIQMVLSTYRSNQSFLDLFYAYSRKPLLLDIIKHNNLYSQQIIQKLNQSRFSPQQVASNWAEPFICKLICQDKNIKSRLFLLNGYPHANAPEFVFEQKKNFKQFVQIVKNSIVNSPVMIDDGYLAMAILAYKPMNQNKHGFIIGDPHIISNKFNNKVGIYQIVCDQQGRQIKHYVSNQALKEAYTNSLPKTYFYEKNWMVLVTQGRAQDHKQ